HLHKLEKEPALITRIGTDDRGKELERIFSSHGVYTGYFQHDPEHETGVVYAHPRSDHEMVYDIVKPVAWDFISWRDEYANLVGKADFFVFGSLAARGEVSHRTLMHLLESAGKRVFDINLRSPHYNQQLIEILLQKTNILKLNESELNLIAGWFGYQDTIEDSVLRIMEKFGVETVVVTMGKDGAMLFMQNQVFAHKGFHVKVADTVGSGDAFLAGLLSKLLDHALPAEALEYACGMGAFIASKTGACPDYLLKEIDDLIGRKEIFQV
ncbi:MAG TPA: PfkB family carbohydrate kinase, partial [Chitinophagaceae bacterium]